MIQRNDQRYRLYVPVDPATGEFLHVRHFPVRTIVISKQFFTELAENHYVADSLILVTRPPWLQAALHQLTLRFQHVTYGNRNAVERLFEGVKRRSD